MAKRLAKKILLIGWDAALMDVDGHSFLKCFDVRDEGWVCYIGSHPHCEHIKDAVLGGRHKFASDQIGSAQ